MITRSDHIEKYDAAFILKEALYCLKIVRNVVTQSSPRSTATSTPHRAPRGPHLLFWRFLIEKGRRHPFDRARRGRYRFLAGLDHPAFILYLWGRPAGVHRPFRTLSFCCFPIKKEHARSMHRRTHPKVHQPVRTFSFYCFPIENRPA